MAKLMFGVCFYNVYICGTVDTKLVLLQLSWYCKMSRRNLAERFIEPNYATINGVRVGEIREVFQALLTQLHPYGEDIIEKCGGATETPQNGHMANIHHSAFLVEMDRAKDHYIKWLLAHVATADPVPAPINTALLAAVLQPQTGSKDIPITLE
jgi:hypothetical protein